MQPSGGIPAGPGVGGVVAGVANLAFLRHGDGVVEVRFQGRRSNALGVDFLGTPGAALWRGLAADTDVKAVVLSGAGANFCSGIDGTALVEMARGKKAGDAYSFEAIRVMQEAVSAIEFCEAPVIAAVHGACFGGGLDIVAACDIVIADTTARFCLKARPNDDPALGHE